MKTHESLVDLLDQELQSSASSETLDATDSADLQYLKLAAETVQFDAISRQVALVRASFEKNESAATNTGAVVRPMFRMSMRIAAILVVVLGAAVLYKYISVTDQSVYNKQFTAYELTNTRGTALPDAQSVAYRNNNWKQVIALYKTESVKTNKSVFLAAMAEMQLKNFPASVALFENVLANKNDNAFQEEAEYYLSLAYLMNHQESKSIELMNKITADTGHTYYPMSSRLSPVDLKIIELKNK